MPEDMDYKYYGVFFAKVVELTVTAGGVPPKLKDAPRGTLLSELF